MKSTSTERIIAIHDAQKEFFRSGATLDIKFRKEMLVKFLDAMNRWEKELTDALWTDLHKSYEEAYLTEISIVKGEIKTHLRKLAGWARRRKAHSPIKLLPSRSYIVKEPLGSSLIISPWNYPVQMVFSPLIAALAAGNCVAIKPSDLAPKTQKIVETIIKETFEKDHVRFFVGGKEVGQELLKEKFDHIFFAGNQENGKYVMHAAAEHLTSVTLELGGKNPCIVDESADIKVAAKRIVWGKCLNCGQTAVAPDYIMVARSKMNELIDYMQYYLDEFYPNGVFNNPDYPCIINAEQIERLAGYLEEGTVLYGGNYDKDKRKMEPTLLAKMDVFDSKVMNCFQSVSR